MGFWDFINSLRRQAPDPTAIVEACKTSYDYCSESAGKIGNVVKVNGQKVHDYVSDEETREQIGLVSSKLLQNAARYARNEGYKYIPGGKAAAEIISETMNEVKLEKQKRQETETLMKDKFGDGKKPSSKL